MNFNFGTPKTTEGFTLGTNTNTPAAASTVINYAAGDNKGLSTPQQGAKTQSFGLSLATPTATNTSGFQLGGTPTNTSATGFQLGGTPANTSATGFQLGGTPTNTSATGFQLGGTLAPANTSTNVAFPLLGTPNKTTFGATPIPKPPSINFSLGSTLTAHTSAPTLFSSLAKTTTPTLATSGTVASTPTFNLGSTLGSTSTPPASTGFTLGGVSSTGITPATTTTTTTSTFTLGNIGTTPATTTATTGLSTVPISLPSTSTAVNVTPASTGTFTFGQLEEALNKWTLELEDQGKMFINQALQLNAWDRLVIANGEKILTLNNGIEKVKQQQLQLDHELDFVLAQQRELEECIAPLEKELKDIPITDQDRNHTYQIAENMDTQLKQMSEDLKEIIEHLNESNKTEETNDPVAQIGRILNAHMNSLQWIDRNTAQISTYLDQITKMHDMHRRDNERSFHLTYE